MIALLEKRQFLDKFVKQICLVYSGKVILTERGLSSAGRASALQAEGHRFEPCRPHLFYKKHAGVAELADAQDLKSCGTNLPYRFDSGRRH